MKSKGGTKKYIGNNKQWILVPDRSFYNVVTSLPRDSDTHQGLVARETTTTNTYVELIRNIFNRICTKGPRYEGIFFLSKNRAITTSKIWN